MTKQTKQVELAEEIKNLIDSSWHTGRYVMSTQKIERLRVMILTAIAQAQQEAVERERKTIANRHLEIAEENLKIYRGMEEMAIEQSKALIKILKALQKEQD